MIGDLPECVSSHFAFPELLRASLDAKLHHRKGSFILAGKDLLDIFSHSLSDDIVQSYEKKISTLIAILIPGNAKASSPKLEALKTCATLL